MQTACQISNVFARLVAVNRSGRTLATKAVLVGPLGVVLCYQAAEALVIFRVGVRNLTIQFPLSVFVAKAGFAEPPPSC